MYVGAAVVTFGFQWKHGHFSREAKAERSRLRAAMLALRDLRDSI
jgi:hypothetical protein